MEMGVSGFFLSNDGEGWTTVTIFEFRVFPRERERGKGSRRGWDAALVPEPLNCAEGGLGCRSLILVFVGWLGGLEFGD